MESLVCTASSLSVSTSADPQRKRVQALLRDSISERQYSELFQLV
jgi:hypothetical protein